MQKIPLFRAIEILGVLSVVPFIVGNFTFIAGDRKTDEGEDRQEVLGEKADAETVIPTQKMEEQIQEEAKEISEENPNPTATPAPTTATGSYGEDFIYPGANNIGGSTYESSDSPESITDWYKEKIISRNMNVKSFVTTKTNGNILNKLSGADGSVNISIEIEKKEGDAMTKITLVQ